ncbi:MAG: hypothetical protein AAFR54_02225, partial [Planctomycetota bacterium]
AVAPRSPAPMPIFALSTQPVDVALWGGLGLLVLSAVRAFVSGKGQAGMGLGFMIVASLVSTFAIGRQVTDFGTVDGLRVAAGVLLLVPVLRAAVGKGGATFGVVSLLLAAVSAGPVVQRAFPDQIDLDPVQRVELQLERVSEELERKQAVWEQLIAKQTEVGIELEAFGLESAAALGSNPEAMEAAQRYARLDAETGAVKGQVDELRDERSRLRTSLELYERTGSAEAIAEAEAILERVEGSIERFDRTALEEEVDRAKAIEVFEARFLARGEGSESDEGAVEEIGEDPK